MTTEKEETNTGAVQEAVPPQIDIDKVFREKNPRLYPLIPRFVLSYLKRVVHQEEINEFLRNYGYTYGLPFVADIMKEYRIDPRVSGLERIPAKGRYIVAANHPLGGMDGIALIHTIGQVRDDIVFPVNDILMNIPNLVPLFIPINKHGSNAENVRIINETFASDVAVLYFPAGLVSRKQKEGIGDLEWKKTVITRARRFKRDIYPVYISGRNSNFFYNLANLRKKLGIKANIEMLYLVDEVAKLKERNFQIVIGKRIPYTTFDKRFTDQQWAGKLREHVYALKENRDLEFPFI
jgi:putative hemolysin